MTRETRRAKPGRCQSELLLLTLSSASESTRESVRVRECRALCARSWSGTAALAVEAERSPKLTLPSRGAIQVGLPGAVKLRLLLSPCSRERRDNGIRLVLQVRLQTAASRYRRPPLPPARVLAHLHLLKPQPPNGVHVARRLAKPGRAAPAEGDLSGPPRVGEDERDVGAAGRAARDMRACERLCCRGTRRAPSSRWCCGRCMGASGSAVQQRECH